MSVYSHFILAPFLNGVVGSEKPSNLPEVTQLVKWQNPQTRHSSTYESKALPLAIIQCQGPAPGFRGTAAGEPNLKSHPSNSAQGPLASARWAGSSASTFRQFAGRCGLPADGCVHSAEHGCVLNE